MSIVSTAFSGDVPAQHVQLVDSRVEESAAAARDLVQAPAQPARLRLQLSEDYRGAGSACADGVWWPRSLDLAAEVGPLLLALPLASRHARGVMYNLDAWQPAPRKVMVDGSVVRLGGYRMLSPDVVHITGTGSAKALVLTVLLPATDSAVAAARLAPSGPPLP